MRAGSAAKRLLVGRPLDSGRLGETLLPKRLALPISCSDPLSSVAYATEEILLILALGGLAVLHLAWCAAIGSGILLVVVVASCRQTRRTYPGGGGAYVVSAENLGQTAARREPRQGPRVLGERAEAAGPVVRADAAPRLIGRGHRRGGPGGGGGDAGDLGTPTASTCRCGC
ncbi:hypothetical protein [Streptomyces sp. NPDC046332]|uniref:hypothetical protein n=1 Tax=Streptomyces sp. NPDC046332 TaxID=3155133 RepID=UPI0033DED314